MAHIWSSIMSTFVLPFGINDARDICMHEYVFNMRAGTSCMWQGIILIKAFFHLFNKWILALTGNIFSLGTRLTWEESLENCSSMVNYYRECKSFQLSWSELVLVIFMIPCAYRNEHTLYGNSFPCMRESRSGAEIRSLNSHYTSTDTRLHAHM